MSTFKLDDIAAAARRRFEPVKIEVSEGETVTLPALLRLSQDDRDAVAGLLKDISDMGGDDEDDLDDDAAELLADSITNVLVRVSKGARKISRAIEHEEPLIQVSILTDILNTWISRTQAGEA
jgi:hypothetical protein